MNLLDLAIKIAVKDEATAEARRIGGQVKTTLADAAKAGAKAMAAAAAAGAAAVGVVGGKALEVFATFEQLEGGVATLFGSSSDALMSYAMNAYKTAGLSANAYMDQATGFAASLVSSLGGDTAAAVEYANRAIVDMSDNTNKMGTDIGALQYAYQGFAKQNYTMLDNLKLGYGGTQQEMQRLIQDAAKLTDVQSELGVTVDASSMSFDNIVNAIHVMQTHMGIAGATSQEAASTIEGSVNAMKGAWENWLAALANPDADMSEFTSKLLECVENVISNVAPRVAEIARALADQLPSVMSGIGERLGPILVEGVAGAWNMAVDAIKGFGIELPEVDASGVESALSAVSGALGALRDNADWLVPSLAAVVGGLLGFEVATSLSAIIEGVRAGMVAWKAATDGMTLSQIALNVAMNANPIMIVVTAVSMLIAGLVALFVTNEDFRNKVVEIWEAVKQAALEIWGAIVNFFTVTVPEAIQQMLQWFSELPARLQELFSDALSKAGEWASGMASNALQAGSQFVSNVVSFIGGLPGQVWSFLSDIVSRVGSWVGDMASGAWNAAAEFGSNLIDGIASLPSRVAEIGGQIVQGIASGITGAAWRVVDAIGSAVGGAIDWAKSLLGIASPSKVFRRFGEYAMEGFGLGVDDESDYAVRSVREAMSAVSGAASAKAPARGGSVVNNYYNIEGVTYAEGSDEGRAVAALFDVLGRTRAAYAASV